MITLISGMLALTGCGSSAPSASSSAPGSDTSTEWLSLPPVVSTEQFCTVKVPAGITQRALQAPDGLSLSSALLGSADQDNPLRTIRPRHVDDQLHLVAVTAAGATKPDAIVILSSSAQEEHSDIAKDAPNVTMPALFALSRADHDDLVVVRSQLKKMPTKKKEFLIYDSGHGYTLLQDVMTEDFTGLASRVAKWVTAS